MDYEMPDQPIPQRLRVVTVMDAYPGRADDAENGMPIGIITFGHRSEIEQPLMLRLNDVRKLARSLLVILASFGDDCAENIVLHHLDGLGATTEPVTVGGGNGGLDSPLAQSEPPALPPPKPVPMMGLAMTVKFGDRKLAPMELQIVGGYRCREETMLMFRCDQFGCDPVESLVKLVGDGRVRFKGHGEGEVLSRRKWFNFCALPEGKVIRIDRRLWWKMSVREIKALVKRKVFRVAPPSPCTTTKRKSKAVRSCPKTKVSKSQGSGVKRRTSRR